jgi:glycoside/pentoside/hexuronide:cation symporter, GPH family
MNTPTTARVPLKTKLFYGLGMTAYGVKDNGFSTFLLIFYNQVIGLDPKIVSFALALALVIDAFADPIIGYLSDRTYTRWGRRLPWLYAAPIPLAIAWMLLWIPPEGLSDTGIFFYLLFLGIVVRTLLSCCEVPSVALVPELTSDYDERTVVMRFRYLFSWAGGLLMLSLAYSVFLKSADGKSGQLNPEGYWHYGLFGALLMATAVLVSARGLHNSIARWPDQKPAPGSIGSAFAEIKESLSHRAFLILIGAAAILLTTTQTTFVISNYLYLYVWQFSQSAFAAYPFLLFGSVLTAFFFTPIVAKRFGKREAAVVLGLASTCFWVIPFAIKLLGYWPASGAIPVLFAFFFMANVCGVIAVTVISSMIADVVEASEVETGRRNEGVFYAGWFFVQKCATGMGILITGLILSLVNFPQKAVPGQVPQNVLDHFSFAYCGLLIVGAITSAMIFWRFPISRADHEERVRTLAAQKSL